MPFSSFKDKPFTTRFNQLIALKNKSALKISMKHNLRSILR